MEYWAISSNREKFKLEEIDDLADSLLNYDLYWNINKCKRVKAFMCGNKELIHG